MSKREHRAAEVFGVVSALYGLHSLFAWEQTKALARRWLGRRYDDGLYRFFYTVQSFASAAVGLLWFLRQPDQEIYHLRRPWSLLARGVQLGGIAVLLDVLHVVGPLRMLGVRQAAAALRGRVSPPTPEAQGPPLRQDGAMDARGTFRYIRHPDNLPAVLLFIGFPRMTWNRLALAVATLLYAVVGSLHEDVRLRRAYGGAFARYERSVPLIVPGLRAPRAS
jgi:protein-S-isoprenylcysteine O-methyltransferase Ste14